MAAGFLPLAAAPAMAQTHSSHALGTVISCGAGNATPTVNRAIVYASQHPDPTLVGPSGAPQGLVRIRYAPTRCRIYGVRLLSNVRLKIAGGVSLKEYGTGHRFMIGLGTRTPITNASVVVGSPTHGARFRFLVNARRDGNNPDVHPIRIHDCSFCLVDGAWFRGNASQSSDTTTSGMVDLNGANDHVDLEDLVGIHQPANYGVTEVNAAKDLTANHIIGYGGVVLRLEWAEHSSGIVGMTASHLIGFDCHFVLDLSAHSGKVTGVSAASVASHSCDAGVNATNGPGYTGSGGGTVEGAVTGGCVYAGPSAQKTTSAEGWITVHSEYVARVYQLAPGAVTFSLEHLGFRGRFTKSTTGGDPSVNC